MLLEKTLKYGEICSFVCEISHKNGLKLYADGLWAYSGYVKNKNYSWLQVECFEGGCNFTITAGKDTPKCFECLIVGSGKRIYFLMHGEPKGLYLM